MSLQIVETLKMLVEHGMLNSTRERYIHALLLSATEQEEAWAEEEKSIRKQLSNLDKRLYKISEERRNVYKLFRDNINSIKEKWTETDIKTHELLSCLLDTSKSPSNLAGRRSEMPKTLEWTAGERAYGMTHYEDGVGLVRSGDLDLTEKRTLYRERYDRETTLTDDQLTILYMSGEDDFEDDWYSDRVASAEQFFHDNPDLKYDLLAVAADEEARASAE